MQSRGRARRSGHQSLHRTHPVRYEKLQLDSIRAVQKSVETGVGAEADLDPCFQGQSETLAVGFDKGLHAGSVPIRQSDCCAFLEQHR